MIGISITTRNRPRVLQYTLNKLAKFDNEILRTVVINDGETDVEKMVRDHGFIYLKNEVRKGIPFSKEWAFRVLRDCDYQFWLDDDCFPKIPFWWEPWVKAMDLQGHLLYLREWAHIKRLAYLQDNIVEYSGATGCFMTFRNDMYKDIHGVGQNLKMYGNYWHPGLSEKMSGYGIGTFCSIAGAEHIIHSFDMDGPPRDFDHMFQSSVSQQERKGK